MSVKLAKLNFFKTVRTQSGAIATDGAPAVGGVPLNEQVDSDGATNIMVYWGATAQTGTVTLELYALDSASVPNRYVKMGEATLVPPDTVVALPSQGASNLYVAFAAAGGAAGSSDAFIRAARANTPF